MSISNRPLRGDRRREVVLSGAALVDVRPWSEARSVLAVASPAAAAGHVDLAAWIRAHRPRVDALLLEHRALLFRGFGVDAPERFAEVVAAASDGDPLDAPGDESTPRAEAGARRVYASTFYPQHQTIALHNEGAYCFTWPRKIFFCCLTAPGGRGETPICDVRRVLARIPLEIQARFEARGVRYVRNYNAGVGLTWQQAFYTDDRAKVEAYCKAHAIEVEWLDGERLRTVAVRPAVQRHPITGERLWFNHAAFFHLAAREADVRQALVSTYGEDGLPFQTFYGDGSPIDPADVRTILDAYDAERILFPWARGDVLLLDNMTVAHGREPFEGARRVVVALSEPRSVS
ncbi:TauD/TfdA family dioxygenase [Sorangium cellulosum]|uniref:TauD/TfdA family dioxygenase n=1 Tax=Sorangium cellulosum TaxID=56 RepID=UPI000416A10C|nr:TauD/TfdA family dioxygenase [Sorangium cellulosum]